MIRSNHQKKSAIKKKSGFTLIELLVAFAFFSVIIGDIVLLSVRAIEANQRAQAIQTTLENTRFAMESLGKKIRTSSFIKSSGSYSSGRPELFFIDNLDGSKYCYEFGQDKNGDGKRDLIVYKDPATSAATSCATMVSNHSIVLTNKFVDVTGSFLVKESDFLNDPQKRGMVTIVINLSYDGGMTGGVAEKDKVTIQTTVSLRDY